MELENFEEKCHACGKQAAVAINHHKGVAECRCADCYGKIWRDYPPEYGPKPTATVEQALRMGFPRSSESVTLRYHVGDGFWSFVTSGMFVGIEPDGYMHS